MISPKVIHHLGGKAQKIAVELERARPNNEKAVPKKTLSSTLNQLRMRERYIKLFRTAYTLAIEPTLPLSQFKTLAKVQTENAVGLIQAEY